MVTGYKADILAKRGLQAEVWAWSEEKTNAILASGDLPDIMFVNGEKLNTLIEAGLVLNLDDYLTEEKLPHVLGDSPLMTAINYSREYRSAGEGVLYGIPRRLVYLNCLKTMDFGRYGKRCSQSKLGCILCCRMSGNQFS